MDARYQPFVGDVQQGHARGFVDAATLGFDDAVLDLVAHAQTMTPADDVGLHEQINVAREGLAIQRHRTAFLEAHRHGLCLHRHIVAPEGHAHDGLDDMHARLQELQVLGLVRRTQHIAVGGIGLLDAHLVVEAGCDEVFAHLLAAAEFVDEGLVQPRLVDLQRWIGQQAVAVEALDVVALVGAAVAPDVDAVFAHRHH